MSYSLRITSWGFALEKPLADNTTRYETLVEALAAKAFVLSQLPNARPLLVNQPVALPAGMTIEHYASVHYRHRFVLVNLDD